MLRERQPEKPPQRHEDTKMHKEIMAPLIEIAGQRFLHSELAAWTEVSPAAPALSANAQAALQFCREWQRGAPEFIVQTSGSTGAPKPIALTRDQLAASARATGAALGLAAGDRALVCLPTQYIAGRMMLVRGLVLGLDLVVVEPAADPFAGLPADARFDFAAFVPLQLHTLLETALVAPSDSCFGDDTARAFRYRRLLEGMKAILVGGGPVSPALAAMIDQLAAPVYHTYGMTETATHVALRRLNGPAAAAAFTPLPGVHLGVDARGCLHIQGPMTDEVRVQTNDLVELQADGTFLWLGRWDNVINSGGVKVQVEQVEEALAQHGGAVLAGRRFFVAGLPDERLGQRVALVVEGEQLAAGDEQALAQVVAQHVQPYAAPRQFVYCPRFAETPTGKIDRGQTLATLSQTL